MSGLLEVERVTLRFGGLTAVNQVSFAVAKGEIVAVIGPNGAGKTSLFNTITGIYTPTAGRVLVEGDDMTAHYRPALYWTWGAIAVVAGLATTLAINANAWWAAAFRQQPLATFAWGKAFAAGLGAVSIGWWLLPTLIGAGIGGLGAWSVWARARRGAERVARAGVARTFQNIRLFTEMTALDNVLVGMDAHLTSRGWDAALNLPHHRQEQHTAAGAARALLAAVGLENAADATAGSLPYGHQRRLEIARALAGRPKLLLLDEPAAGMNPAESQALMLMIRRIRDTGVTVLLIEHDMSVVMGISDRIVVLHYGEKIAEGTPAAMRVDPKVIEAYLGTEVIG